MQYSNPDRRTILKTMTSLAAASSMANITIGTIGRAEAAAASDPALSPALGDVDQALRQAVNARTVPGLVAIAANDKGIVYEGAFGPAITADSLFWIASMTKAITGAACMQLVEQGKLQLDQEMGKLLPQLEQPKVLEGSTPAVRQNFALPSGRSRCDTFSLTLRGSSTVSGASR